jgi:hypothetical protein
MIDLACPDVSDAGPAAWLETGIADLLTFDKILYKLASTAMLDCITRWGDAPI